MLRKVGYNFILKTPPNLLLGKFGKNNRWIISGGCFFLGRH